MFLCLLCLRQLPSLPLPFVSLTLLKNASQFCRLSMLPQDESTLYNLGRSMSLQEKMLCQFLHSSHPDLGYFHLGLGKMFCSYVGEPSNRWETCSKKGCTQFCKWGVKVLQTCSRGDKHMGNWDLPVVQKILEAVLRSLPGNFVLRFIPSLHSLIISLKSVSSLRTKLETMILTH